jgi:hypothetical protein
VHFERAFNHHHAHQKVGLCAAFAARVDCLDSLVQSDTLRNCNTKAVLRTTRSVNTKTVVFLCVCVCVCHGGGGGGNVLWVGGLGFGAV